MIRTSDLDQAPRHLFDGLATLDRGGDQLTVHFLNVGQGDCVLISSGEWAALCDAGKNPSEAVLSHITSLLEGPAREPLLNLLVVSHYDADHIDGAAAVVERLQSRIGHVFVPPFLRPLLAMDEHANDLAMRLYENSENLRDELWFLDQLAAYLAEQASAIDVDPADLVKRFSAQVRRREELNLSDR